jgi:hypothetical protein
MVDAVSEVLEVSSADIEPAPAFGAKIRADFIDGMGKIGGKFVIILDIQRVLSVDEMAGAGDGCSGSRHRIRCRRLRRSIRSHHFGRLP